MCSVDVGFVHAACSDRTPECRSVSFSINFGEGVQPRLSAVDLNGAAVFPSPTTLPLPARRVAAKKTRTIADHGHGEVSCRVVKLRESSKRFY